MQDFFLRISNTKWCLVWISVQTLWPMKHQFNLQESAGADIHSGRSVHLGL